jgi:hypothetical protein
MGLTPICLLINRLSLGLICEFIFSFIDGRRPSDFLTTGMCINLIAASGVTTVMGKALLNLSVPELGTPELTGSVIFPPLTFGAYFLELLPDPNKKDIRARRERVPVTGCDRIQLLHIFSPGIGLMTILCMLLSSRTTLHLSWGQRRDIWRPGVICGLGNRCRDCVHDSDFAFHADQVKHLHAHSS